MAAVVAGACGNPDRPPPDTTTAVTRGPATAAALRDRATAATEATEPSITDLYPYALDNVSREVEPRGKVRCPDLDIVRYPGDVIRYQKAARIYVGFVPKLRRMEEIVRDTAIEFYGRPPRRIKHLGTYYCRRIRSWPTFISEHGLGNAIDVEGFDFAYVSRKEAPDVPRRLRRGFQVRVEKHWNGRRGNAATHARFLRTLARRLVDEEGLFRVMLGPAEPGHHNHFHFDAAPWRIVNIFEDGGHDPMQPVD